MWALLLVIIILLIYINSTRENFDLIDYVKQNSLDSVLSWSKTQTPRNYEGPYAESCASGVKANANTNTTEHYIPRHVYDPRTVIVDTTYTPSVTYDEISGPGNTYYTDPGQRYGPFHDIDREFVSTRSRMGACGLPYEARSRVGSNLSLFSGIDSPSLDSSLSGKNDDAYDGSRCAAFGSQPCTQRSTAVSLLYKDVMGLDIDAPPAAEDCEFRSTKDYDYKEPCMFNL